MLNQARSQYIAGQYVVAKKTIDSIAKVDPKAFVQINAGYDLLDSVRYAENIQTITNSENSLKDIESKLVKQKALFNYESIQNIKIKEIIYRKVLHSLRPQVSIQGWMRMENCF